MLALALITRDTKDDAILLDRLLENITPHVDKVFITNTTKDGAGEVKRLCEKYDAEYSYFEWVKDFSAARNFNFSQVPEEYGYIMWSDIDDVWRGLENLKDVLKSKKDAYAFWYLYDFDEDKQPIVAHKKTMIVRNDGSFIWKGAIHEDLDAEREIDIEFSDKIERLHLTNEVRINEAKERNEEIAAKDYKENPNDPRTHFNYGNTLIATGKYQEAKEVFETFMASSQSEEEKYLVLIRLASINFALGHEEPAIDCLYKAIGMKPTYPDAFLDLGALFYDLNRLDKAEEYIMQGIVRKPSYQSMIVHNPRDYDYNPMNMLAKIYFRKSRPDLALPVLEGCLKINPNNDKMKQLVAEMRRETTDLENIYALVKSLKKIKGKKKLKEAIEALPVKQRSHPAVCQLWNQSFLKKKSSGKDVVFYCGYTEHEWNPILFKKKGFGGSEEAIIHLSRFLASKGMNVEVYANIGPDRIEQDGVLWKPFWEFNSQDATDHLILWRTPRMCDYDLAAKNIYIDLHDVIKAGEFTKQRLEKIKKIFVKTKFHRSLFPNVPDEKFAIIPNGIKIDDYDKKPEKDKYLIINTSSPDRSMEAAVEIFRQVKEKVPQARFQWAYGWDVFDSAHQTDKKMMDWKNSLVKKMDEAGVEQLGKIPQHEIADLYLKANIMLYPTEFAEIDCISVKKAQLAGCKVITTDFGALDESVQHGVKIHSEKNQNTWAKPYQFQFAIEDKRQIDRFVSETIVTLLSSKDDSDEREAARKFGQGFDWKFIGDKWYNELCK